VIVYYNSACTDIYSCISKKKVIELLIVHGKEKVEIVEEVDYEEKQREGKSVAAYFEMRRRLRDKGE
jgi:hypothetical protein